MKRSDNEHESSRRLKTEFLVQLDGAHTSDEKDRVLLVGATNLPQELDDAARRRFTKRLYIPLPEVEVRIPMSLTITSNRDHSISNFSQARCDLIAHLLRKNENILSNEDIVEVAHLTVGYSGADIKSLCSDAAMQSIREISPEMRNNVTKVASNISKFIIK